MILTLFKSRADLMGHVFKSGKAVHFVQGRYATAAKTEIAELTAECEDGHPVFYIDPNETTIDSEQLDPFAALRAKIREEERAKLLAATDPNRDLGATSQSGKLEGIATSASIAGLMVASESEGLAANNAVARTPIVVAPSARSLAKQA